MAPVRRIKLSDVARRAGVSPATVSRAISQPDLLSTSTLKRVQAAAQALGYVPDAAARALASGRSMTIGAVVPTLDSTIFARFLQSTQSTLARDGYQLLVASHEMNPAAELEAVRTLLSRGVDGLILVGADRPRATLTILRSSKTPTVLTWCGAPEFASVTVDNEGAGYLAARHLIDLGHERIGVIVGKLAFNDRQRARLAGARRALRETGRDIPDWRVSEQDLTLAGGRLGCAALLQLDDMPTAIIGAIDLFAIGCLQETQARGVTVPSDFSIVGIDDLDMSAYLTPSLTTVRIPTGRIGESAAATVVGLLESQWEPTHLDLPIELVVRQSTAGPTGRGRMSRQRRSRR
ncbi:MAG TPA: LacI family DNA-binding transcriptional regulator [Beijerinckiaceae bacterium]